MPVSQVLSDAARSGRPTPLAPRDVCVRPIACGVTIASDAPRERLRVRDLCGDGRDSAAFGCAAAG